MGNNLSPNYTLPNNFSGIGNPVIPNGMPYNNMGINPTIPQYQNINSLYPSIYRIVNPVVSRVLSNNNQMLNEDILNNMTDTVFNIIEGQIDYGDDTISRNTQTESSNLQNTTTTNSNTRTSENRPNNNSQTNSKNNKSNDSLLKDLIRILILKEFISRNHNMRNNIPNQYYYPMQNF